MSTFLKEDFLTNDNPIPGQNFACLSFVSPENIIEKKELYQFYKYLKLIKKELEFDTFKEDFKDFCNNNEKEINNDFNVIENFKTNIRGLKIRGVYDTQHEANIRAQVLQKLDSSFHVYVGQVGFWLPWEPKVDSIENQQYQEEHLNNLVQRYKTNEIERDNYYAKETEERKKKCIEDNIKSNVLEKDKKINDISINSEEIKDKEEKYLDNEEEIKVDSLIDILNDGETHQKKKESFKEFS
jgi:hypothetical protein